MSGRDASTSADLSTVFATLTRLGQIADAVYVMRGDAEAKSFQTNAGPTPEHRTAVEQLVTRYRTQPPADSSPSPAEPQLATPTQQPPASLFKSPEYVPPLLDMMENAWEETISARENAHHYLTAYALEGEITRNPTDGLAAAAWMIRNSEEKGTRAEIWKVVKGTYDLFRNRGDLQDALRCGAWLRRNSTESGKRAQALKMIRSCLLEIQDHGKQEFLSTVQDVWEAHVDDSPVQSLAFRCLFEPIQTALSKSSPSTEFRKKGMDPSCLYDIARWTNSRPGVTDAAAAATRLAVIHALQAFQESAPLQTMNVVRNALQNPLFEDVKDQVAKQGVATLPLLARVNPAQAATIALEPWLWEDSRVPTAAALTDVFTTLAEQTPQGVGPLAHRFWQQAYRLRSRVEQDYRRALGRVPDPVAIAADYGQKPHVPELDRIVADTLWHRLRTLARSRQIGPLLETLQAVEQQAATTPQIVYDVLGETYIINGKRQSDRLPIRSDHLLKMLNSSPS